MHRRYLLFTAALTLPFVGEARADKPADPQPDLVDDSQAIPFAANASRVPVGTWATYRKSFFEGSAPNDIRIALVSRSRKSVLWELSFYGPEKTKVVAQLETSLKGGVPHEVLSRVSRFGDLDPVIPPLDPNRKQLWFRVPGGQGGAPVKESLTVSAGTFRCQRLSQAGAPGVEYVYWVDRKAAPTSVVRFQRYFTGGNGVRTVQETWELVEMGRGAKPSLSRDAVARAQNPKPKT